MCSGRGGTGMIRRTVLLLALLAVLMIVVPLVSRLAGRYYYGSRNPLSVSQAPSAENSVSGMSAPPTEKTTTDEATKEEHECPGSYVCGTEGDDSLRGT